MKVTLEISVEELVACFPETISYLSKKGVRCVRCSEPFWGTLGELLEEEAIEDPQALIEEINIYIQRKRK